MKDGREYKLPAVPASQEAKGFTQESITGRKIVAAYLPGGSFLLDGQEDGKTYLKVFVRGDWTVAASTLRRMADELEKRA
jgi:hypothetical protein